MKTIKKAEKRELKFSCLKWQATLITEIIVRLKKLLTKRYTGRANDPHHTNEQDHAKNVLHTGQKHAGDRT